MCDTIAKATAQNGKVVAAKCHQKTRQNRQNLSLPKTPYQEIPTRRQRGYETSLAFGYLDYATTMPMS